MASHFKPVTKWKDICTYSQAGLLWYASPAHRPDLGWIEELDNWVDLGEDEWYVQRDRWGLIWAVLVEDDCEQSL